MIYSDDCFKCPYKVTEIEPEIERAKEFYRKKGTAWRFSCGANYYPPILNSLGVEIYPNKCMLEKDNKTDLRGLS